MAQTSTCLCLDLQKIGLFPINPIEGKPEVSLILRPYSKTYYGRYFPDSSRIFIYPYNDEDGNFMSFTSILCTTIHEMVHHIQHQDPNFKRQKGIMHDPKFWELYNHFLDRAVSKSILVREEIENIG